jgi:hypothetical protein
MLSREISVQVSALAPWFRFQEIEIRRGSVEFWVYLAGGFTLISQYDDFVRSLEVLVKQIQAMLHTVFSGRFPGISIAGGWTPVRPKRRRLAPSRILQEPRDLITLLMASYLILSHGFMLAVLVRIALKVFLPAK